MEIARALATEPAFMLLDEPFAGIDPLAIADIREVITYLKGRGIGILITDHNVRETLDIIDTASIIHAGAGAVRRRPAGDPERPGSAPRLPRRPVRLTKRRLTAATAQWSRRSPARQASRTQLLARLVG